MDVQFVKSAAAWKDLPEEGIPEVAFIGRSNVGKSSLLNALIHRKNMARISSTPGKTQTLNFYLVDQNLFLVDLPGYGYAKTAKTNRLAWAKLMERYLSERKPLKLICQLIDSRTGVTASDKLVISLLKGAPCFHILILTKADKLNQKERHQTLKDLDLLLREMGQELMVILTSSEKKVGMAEIWQWIEMAKATSGDESPNHP